MFDTWPTMELYVNEELRTTWTVSGGSYADYSVSTNLTGFDQIDMLFTNDYYNPPRIGT